MKKILIIGPFEDYGGRELEAGFIASRLHEKYDLEVISTANLTLRSQIFEFEPELNVSSLKQLLFRNNFILRPAALFSYLKNRGKEPVYFYVNNRFNSRKLKKREKELISKIIPEYDLVFIVAHLFTLRTKNLINTCTKNKVPIIFRTTGEIEERKEFPYYLKSVDHFLHHSKRNACCLHNSLGSILYSIVDQTAFYEKRLLEIPILNKKIKNFLFVGRLSPEKNLINLVNFFKKYSTNDLRLLIIGDGELNIELKELTRNFDNINIKGYIPPKELVKIYCESDCLIISSNTEAGPLVGIEAMAAGRIIFSTEVGAMPERMVNTHNNFWFKPQDQESFRREFERLKNLTNSEVSEISELNRYTYIERYSNKAVSKQYYDCVSQILFKNSKVCS